MYFTTIYLKLLFQKFHLIANTQLGAHLICHTEIQAELFSVKYQPLLLTVVWNINLTNQQITRLYNIFVIYHIFILQNVEPCFNEINRSICSFNNYLVSHLKESKDFLRECVFLPLCCYSLNHRHQQSLDVSYWYKLTQWPLDYEPAMQRHSQFKNSVSKSNTSEEQWPIVQESAV